MTKRLQLLRNLLIMSALLMWSTNINAQSQQVTVDLKDAPLEDLFSSIEQQTDYRISYRNSVLDDQDYLTVSENSAPVTKVLDSALRGRGLEYEIVSEKAIVVTDKREMAVEKKSEASQQNGANGIVRDSKGEPIIGAMVTVKGSTIGAITEMDGKFFIPNVKSGTTLEASFLGYNTAEVVYNGASTMEIVLEDSALSLDEIVVVGYGAQKKVNLTGAVTTMSADDVPKSQTNSVSNMMKGQLSGVSIIANNGAPGASSTIRIRGVGTLGDDSKNDPLIVVDGQAVEYGIETIDPNDVETISVLKDASSAAIYGSRAANGVILITTKRGAKGEGALSVNISTSVQSMLAGYDMMNTYDYVALQQLAAANAGQTSVYTEDPSYYGEGTDWLDVVTQLAAIQEYNVSFSKSTDKSNYYLSGTYYKQDGIVKCTGYDRISFRFNGDSQIKPKIKVGNSITLTYNSSYGTSHSLGNALIMPPTTPVYMEDGSWGYDEYWGGAGINPLYEAELYEESKTQRYRAMANIYAEYQIYKDLKFKVTGAIDVNFSNYRMYYPYVDLLGEYTSFSKQYLTEQMNISNTWQNDYLLYYNKSFGKHTINAILGASISAYNYKNINATVDGFLNDSEYLQVLSAGQENWRAYGGITNWTLLSYFTNIDYNFDDRFLASFNMRIDGSSRFADGNKYGYFPSGSVAWRINEESFMENTSWISNLKLRASYGSLGNQQIGEYEYHDLLNVSSGYAFGDASSITPGVTSTALVDSSIKWETTTIANVGVDFGVLKNKLSMTAEYYRKDTRDILLDYPIPSTTGKTSPTVNAGHVRNQGFETEFRYQNNFGDLWLSASVIYGYNHNEVISLVDDQEYLSYSGSNAETIRSQIGHSINQVYGYVYEGVYQSEDDIANSPTYSSAVVGGMKFADLNDDGKIDTDDRTFIGNSMPHSTLGFNLSGSYKNFDFSMFWQGDFGKDLYYGYMGGTYAPSTFRNVNSMWNDSWTGEGTSDYMPIAKTGTTYSGNASTFDMFSADYFRLKNLSVGYSFKLKGVGSARVYLAGQNLITFTKFPGPDPEMSGVGAYNSWGDTYPQARSYTIGLNLTF